MTHAPAQTPPQMPYVKAPSNGLATASMVLGIIGTVFAFIPLFGVFGAVLGGIGLVLAVFGLLAANKRGVGKGKAIAGIILGVAAIVICVIITMVTAAAVDSAVKDVNKGIADRTDTSVTTDVSNKDELKDATLGKPFKDEFGSLTVKVTLTNHSPNKSDYTGTVVFESANGKVQYGTGALFVEGLEPGQTKVEKVSMLDELPKNAKSVSVRLTDFDRSESF